MGSGAGFIVLFFLVLYLGPAWWLCAKVAKKTSRKMGWLMATGLIFAPAAVLVLGALYEYGGQG
ncbi:hypothetical protein ACFYP4_16560 [Streptomyces sp. NPDC005551]|uniref:hypothetical protein n=1 Tax=unclassified Streptomyces TaxID=2593676 RepID=UPI0033EFBC06